MDLELLGAALKGYAAGALISVVLIGAVFIAGGFH